MQRPRGTLAKMAYNIRELGSTDNQPCWSHRHVSVLSGAGDFGSPSFFGLSPKIAVLGMKEPSSNDYSTLLRAMAYLRYVIPVAATTVMCDDANVC